MATFNPLNVDIFAIPPFFVRIVHPNPAESSRCRAFSASSCGHARACRQIFALSSGITTNQPGSLAMSILSTLAGALEGAPNSGNATPGGINLGGIASSGALISEAISMIQNRPGGLGGLLQSFQQGGLGHVFQSWVAAGQTLPISPDQLHATVGSDWISKIVQATGLPQAQVEQHVSTL